MSDDRSFATWIDVGHRFANAKRSIKVLSSPFEQWNLPLERSFFEYGSSGRVDRRFLIASPSAMNIDEEYALRGFHRLGWKVMWIDAPPSMLGIIVDDEVAFISAGERSAFRVDDQGIVAGLVSHFERTWQLGARKERTRVIYDDVLVVSGPSPSL